MCQWFGSDAWSRGYDEVELEELGVEGKMRRRTTSSCTRWRPGEGMTRHSPWWRHDDKLWARWWPRGSDEKVGSCARWRLRGLLPPYVVLGGHVLGGLRPPAAVLCPRPSGGRSSAHPPPGGWAHPPGWCFCVVGGATPRVVWISPQIQVLSA